MVYMTEFSLNGSVGSMPLQFLEIGFHVEIHAIEWHDFQHETQFHGSCSGMNRIFSILLLIVYILLVWA